MPKKWVSQLKYTFLPTLESSSNKAIEYFTKRDLWKLDYSKGAKEKASDISEKLWLALRIARIFKRFYG